MTEGDPGVRETTKLDPVSEQQHSGGAKPATRPANFADDSHTRLSSCTHNRNRKITFSSDKRTPDLSDGSLFPSGDRDADSTTAAVTDSEVDRRNSSSLHLTYLPRSGFSEAQILKRCRRSSVLCCRCRETPVPPPAVDEEEGGKGASVGHLRQLAGSHAAVEGQGHDCCSCCYCSCGSRDHHPKQPTASCLSSSPPRSSSKTADWPCTSRIICIEGPSRPDTFESNLRKLSEEFPAIHQGLIISLLETAENSLSHARQLVQVVSDTTLSSARPGIPGRRSGRAGSRRGATSQHGSRGEGLPEGEDLLLAPESEEWELPASWRLATTRKRQVDGDDGVASVSPSFDVAPEDVPLASSSGSSSQPGSSSFGKSSPCGSSSSPTQAPASPVACSSPGRTSPGASHSAITSLPSLQELTTPGATGNERERAGCGRGSCGSGLGNARLAPASTSGGAAGISIELWSAEWTQRMLRVIYGATSADDARAKVTALMQEQTEQLVNMNAGSLGLGVVTLQGCPTNGTTSEDQEGHSAPKGADREMEKKVELLQNDKVLLARAVKSQHERIQSLQASLNEKSEELERVNGEKRILQQNVRRMKDATAALLLSASAARGGNLCRENNGPFDRTFPDIC